MLEYKHLVVSYTGGLDTKLDSKVKSFFELLGFEWYAQGMDSISGVRDISFDVNKEEKKK